MSACTWSMALADAALAGRLGAATSPSSICCASASLLTTCAHSEFRSSCKLLGGFSAGTDVSTKNGMVMDGIRIPVGSLNFHGIPIILKLKDSSLNSNSNQFKTSRPRGRGSRGSPKMFDGFFRRLILNLTQTMKKQSFTSCPTSVANSDHAHS